MLQSSWSLSGALPASVGMNSSGQLTAENSEINLWPHTTMESPPIYILPPPVYFQVATQGTLQTLGRLPAPTNPDAPTELGARVRMDLNLQIAGGIPRVLETYGGVGGRVLISAGVSVNRNGNWRISGGDLSLRGALIIGASAGPLRLEWRALEAEILTGNLLEITPAGIRGLTLTWGRPIQELAAFFAEVVHTAERIGSAITAPIRQIVVNAGQTLESALSGVAEVQRVLSCIGGGLGLAIGTGIANQTYGALWDEAIAVSMLQSGGARAIGGSSARDSSINSILGTLYSEYVSGHAFRRVAPNPDQSLTLIGWHQRIQNTIVGGNGDVAIALEELGMSHLGSLRLIEFMWAMQRNGLVAFGGNPNDVADARHGPLIAQMQDAMAAAETSHAASCGG
jgi:hypothetical protein